MQKNLIFSEDVFDLKLIRTADSTRQYWKHFSVCGSIWRRRAPAAPGRRPGHGAGHCAAYWWAPKSAGCWNRCQTCDTWEYERKAGRMCELIINCSDKYSCSQSVQRAVEVVCVRACVCVFVCDDVFGPVSVHDVLKQPLTSPLTEADQPGFPITCSLRLRDQFTDIMESISRKRGRWSTHSPSFSSQIPSLSLSFISTLFISFSLFFLSVCLLKQCSCSILPLISLLRSHSLIALFSLCGKCQVCRWCYLHENWRTKATGNFSHLLPGLIFRRTAEDGKERKSLYISPDDLRTSVVQVHYLNR